MTFNAYLSRYTVVDSVNITQTLNLLLQYDEIELRQLTEADKPVMARLANNKKVWDNLRDLMPHPYNEEDAHFFIELTRNQRPPWTSR